MSTSAPRAITTRRPSITTGSSAARRRIPLYAGKTREIDEAAADQSLRAIVRFLNSRGVIRSETAPGHASAIITNADMTSVSATSAGLLRRVKPAGAHVRRGEQLAFIINPCDGSVREVLKAPVTGMLFFHGTAVHHGAQPGLSGAGGSVSHATKRLPVSPARCFPSPCR